MLINGDTGWATDGQIYNGKYSFQKLLKSNICHQSMFYRRSFILIKQLEYDLKYPISSDWDFNIACRLQSKFTFINTIVAVFNAGGISTGKSITEPFLEERKVFDLLLGALQKFENKENILLVAISHVPTTN